MRRRAVFLDRDGTINYDPGYIDSPEGIKIFPAAVSGMRLLEENNYLLFVVTNQSGVGRGFFSEETLAAIHRKLDDDLKESGVNLTEIAYCPHHPEDGCRCRKPSPYMVRRLVKKYDIDPVVSYFIGDKVSDLLTGRNAGCSPILLAAAEELSGLKMREEWIDPDYIAEDLYQAARWIVKERKSKMPAF